MVQKRREQYQSKRGNYGCLVYEVAVLAIKIADTAIQVQKVIDVGNAVIGRIIPIKVEPKKEVLLLKEKN